jgi:predicted transcriptional regulator
MNSMKLSECSPKMLLKTKSNQLIEVQSIQFNRMKAKVLYPLSKTPEYKEYSEEMVGFMQQPSPELMNKYEKALTERRSKGKKKK